LLFSWLFYQSRCITRILAAWGVLASLFEGLCAFAYLNHREFGAVVSVNWYEMPTVFFELALCIWILATALRPPRAGRQTLRPFHGSRCRDRVRDS
jgi:xanthine/uracil permease